MGTKKSGSNKPKNFLNLQKSMQLMNWVNAQKTNGHANRLLAAEAATKDLAFPVTTFNLRTLERLFPDTVSRICKRYELPGARKGSKNSKNSSNLEKRVATLEAEIERIKKDLYDDIRD